LNITSVGRKEIGIIGLTFIALVAVFYFAPTETRSDWFVINAALQRFLSGEELYQFIQFNDMPYGFFYAPWFAAVLSPLGLVPFQLSAAILAAATILGVLALSRRFELGLVKTLLIFASPPVLYNLFQGQVDILVLLLLFLPREWWPIAALTKPQITTGLAFSIILRKDLWLRTSVVTGIVLGISLLLFGFWPLEILELSRAAFSGDVPHSILQKIWPLQTILAVGLISFGIERDDERFFVAASPFCFSYATIGNYVGVLFSAMTVMKWWQALAVVVTWWLVLIYR
jgi:hypothetical protein